MKQRAVIRRLGPFIDLSVDGADPLPVKVIEEISQPLYYTHCEMSYGVDAYNYERGTYEHTRSERRRLFDIDAFGRFYCLRGYLPRMIHELDARGYAVELHDLNPVKHANTYREDWDRVFEAFSMRPMQDVCLAQVAIHPDGGIIDAAPAVGKMYIIAMLCLLYPKAKIDIVTKRVEIVQSIRRLLLQYIPDVGIITGSSKKANTRVTVISAGSLHHSDFSADIVLADEVHELVTDHYASRLARYWHARMYGFTASKETRFDNAHHRLEGLFGPTIFKLSHTQAVEHKLVAPLAVYWIQYAMDHNPIEHYDTPTAQRRHGIWRNANRNAAIAEVAQQAVNEGHQTLIVVETIEHGLHLHKLLPDWKFCYAEGTLDDSDKRKKFVAAGLWDADDYPLTAVERQTLRHGFENREYLGAIATGVWSVGVSFNALEVLVRADGGSSETASIQTPGRVCRTFDGKEYGLVMDCLDSFDPRPLRRTNTRRIAYGRNGWTQFLDNGEPVIHPFG